MRKPLTHLYRLAALALGLALAAPAVAADEPVTVFAAASLTDAVTEIAEQYEAETGRKIRLSFAASSTLARQIEAGAPADIYASADARWMEYLAERGLVDTASRVTPIGNALVLVAPQDSPLDSVDVKAAPDLPGMLGANGRLAVGDPAHVPAGRYAEQALRTYGLWEDAEVRLAPAADVRAALALVARGEAPLGIVYRTDATIDPAVKVIGEFPEDCHAPIAYPFALVGEPRPAVRRFFDWMTGAHGAEVFSSYGFSGRGTC